MKIIKLTEEQIKLLKHKVENNQSAQIGYQEACKYLKQTKEDLWKSIHKMVPEIKDGELELKWNTKELIIENE